VIYTLSEEVEREKREAIPLHLDGLRADGAGPSEPHAYAAYREIRA
jgi:hypothetical protein